MEVDYEAIPEILLYTIGFFLVYFFCYKRYIYSILDPLFIYIFTLSFSSVLVTSILSDRPAYMAHFFLCHAFLFIGFSLTIYLLRGYKHQTLAIAMPIKFFDYETLRLVVYALFFFYFLANVVLFYTTGFALLSDDPTIAKVENFTNGFGIIRKINFSIGSFITAGLLFFILTESRWLDISFLFIVIVLTGLEGSKSSLIRILITFILLVNHEFFRHRKDITSKIKLLLPVGIIAVFGIFLTVLFKENTDSDQVVFSFVRRLLYGADSILYFYLPVNEQYFAAFNFWQFPGHLLDQILGFLRILTPGEAFGNVMVINAFPNHTGTVVGPNTPYYIEGQIFFGYYGAFAYSLFVGFCYAFIRQYFFDTKYYSAFWFVLMCCACQQASALTIEVTLFITQMFDTVFFVLPVYLIINLIVNGKLILRKLHF
jgi:oligosaccharide repeat unit polymerase